MNHRLALRHGLDCLHQILERHVLEQIPFRAGPHALEHLFVVVEGREDDDRSRESAVGQGLDSLRAVHARHPHIHQYHVGRVSLRDGERLIAVFAFGDDFYLVRKLQQTADTLADQSLIVDQRQANRHYGT